MSSKRRREALTPDLTALIDVVFLLLIFFMVSSVFKKDEFALLLNLPKTEEGSSEASKEDSIVIELNGNEIAFNGESLSLENLGEKLQGATEDSLVDLRVDGDVRYERLVQILDLLRKNNLENLSLITEKNNNS